MQQIELYPGYHQRIEEDSQHIRAYVLPRATELGADPLTLGHMMNIIDRNILPFTIYHRDMLREPSFTPERSRRIWNGIRTSLENYPPQYLTPTQRSTLKLVRNAIAKEEENFAPPVWKKIDAVFDKLYPLEA